MCDDTREKQIEVCRRYGATPCEAPDHQKVGIARNVGDGQQPVHGLRLPPQGDTTGWYVWGGGEMSNDPDFFLPLHVCHLTLWCPAAIPYLQLPPGWRFLIAVDVEDVWYDRQLLGAPEKM